MAKSEPVEVAVDIIDEFSKELKELETKLDKIDGKKLSVELEIDEDGEISKTEKRLKELEKQLEASLDIDVDDAKAKARRKALERDMYSTLHVRTSKSNLGNLTGGYAATGGNVPKGPPRPTGPGFSVPQSDVKENLRMFEGSSADIRSPAINPNDISTDPKAKEAVNWIINDDVPAAMGESPSHRQRKSRKWGGFGLDETINPALPDVDKSEKENIKEKIKKGAKIGDSLGGKSKRNPLLIKRPPTKDREAGKHTQWPLGTPEFYPDMVKDDSLNFDHLGEKSRIGKAKSALGSANKKIAAFNKPFEDDSDTSFIKRIGKTAAKYRPNIMMVWNALALMIPVLVTLAGAAIGLAAAFGTLAVAGGAVVGLGLLGYGENTAEAMENAKQKVNELKSELFDAMKPVTQAFEPIADNILGNIPHQVGQITDEIEGLAKFEGFFTAAIGGAINWVGKLIETMTSMSDKISQIGMRFGSIFGDLLIGLLEWAVKSIYKNQDAIIKLGSILGSLVVIVYNVAAAISFVLSIFAPFFKLLAKISSYINNKWVVGLGAAIVTILALQAALLGLNAVLSMTAGSMLAVALSGVRNLILGLYSLMATALQAVGVVGTLNAALATMLTLASLGLAAGVGVLAMDSMDGGTPGGGGSPGPGGYGGPSGGGGGQTINIYGDVGNSEYQKMQDNFGSMYNEQSEVNDETEK